MQRLFSVFPNGWPGIGLLLLRLAAGGLLLANGIASLVADQHWPAVVPSIAGSLTGVLLIFGLWTPLVGVLAGIAELWTLQLGADRPETAILLISTSLGIAMLGPGCWSIDALLFGRRRLDVTD